MAEPDQAEDVDRKRLSFEQHKWTEELALRREEMRRSRWSAPLFVAIVGATAAALANVAANIVNGEEQNRIEAYKAHATEDLEKEKAEAARILEVVKVGDPDKAAENLDFLLKSHLIADSSTRGDIQHYLDVRAQGSGVALSSGNSRAGLYQPSPTPSGKAPFHLDLSDVSGLDLPAIARAGKVTFQVTANTGGVRRPEFQAAVARAMQDELHRSVSADRPAFLYLLGNLVFYEGEPENYTSQFYVPYSTYQAPIFAIPGNHDAEVSDSSQFKSLDGFVSNFNTATPAQTVPNVKRTTMNEPNVFWTLVTPYACIIGLYTNVPVGGHVDETQAQWLRDEMRSAPRSKALIIALHHSPFSFDTFHSGSRAMTSLIVQAINETKRVPNAVLSAGVFNYQRLELRTGRFKIPFLNIGSGGYWNIHKLAAKAPSSDATVDLVAADDEHHGFATFSVTAKSISGHFTAVDVEDGSQLPQSRIKDKFEYPAGPLILNADETVTLPSL